MCEEDGSLGKKLKGNVKTRKNNVSLGKNWLVWGAWTGVRPSPCKLIGNRMSSVIRSIPRSPILTAVTITVNEKYVKDINTEHQQELAKSERPKRKARDIYYFFYGIWKKTKTKHDAERNLPTGKLCGFRIDFYVGQRRGLGKAVKN